MTILDTNQMVDPEGVWLLFLIIGMIAMTMTVVCFIIAAADRNVKMVPIVVICLFCGVVFCIMSSKTREFHVEVKCMFDDEYPISNILDKYSIKEVNGKIVTLIPKEDE